MDIRRQKFLNADSSMMGKNSRFFKCYFILHSDLEDNRNQYFAGARDSSRGNNAQSRDYNVFQPMPDNNYARFTPSSKYSHNNGRNSRYDREEQFGNNYQHFENSKETHGEWSTNNLDSTTFGGRKLTAFGGSYNSHDKQNDYNRNISFISNDNYSRDRNDGPSGSNASWNDRSQARSNFTNDEYIYSRDRNDGASGFNASWNKKSQGKNNFTNDEYNYSRDRDDGASGFNASWNKKSQGRNNFTNDEYNYSRDRDVGPSGSNASWNDRSQVRNNLTNDGFNYNSEKYKRFNESKNNVYPNSLNEVTTPPTFSKVGIKRPQECQDRGDSNKYARVVNTTGSATNSGSNNVTATCPSTSATVAAAPGSKKNKKKKKDVKYVHRRVNANIRRQEERTMRAEGVVGKPKTGCSKSNPEKYWKNWWPNYAHVETSVLKFDDDKVKLMKPLISFPYKPSDENYEEQKAKLLRLGVSKISRNLNISESNYMARDIFKLFIYKKKLEDPNLHQYLEEDELIKVTNALNSANCKHKLALFLQSLIHRWQDSSLKVERKKNGEDIPGRHAENLLKDDLFHYLVLDAVKELKNLCSEEWPEFNEFYSSL